MPPREAEMNSMVYLQREEEEKEEEEREEKEEEHELGRACTGLESRPVRPVMCECDPSIVYIFY